MLSNAQTQTTTRTVRIKKESDLILEREAERNGISVNAIVSNLVDQYVNSLRFFMSGGMVSMSSDVLVSILEPLSDDVIAEKSAKLGSIKVRDSLLQRGMKVSYESVLWYINQILGQSYGWFRCDHNKDERMDTLHLSHNYGYKWSVFVSGFISSILVNVLNLKINSGISTNAVYFEISKKSDISR